MANRNLAPNEGTRTPDMSPERFVYWSETAHASAESVAVALRTIADRIEASDLCLISIYSAGFGEPWEADLQVICTEFASDEPLEAS